MAKKASCSLSQSGSVRTEAIPHVSRYKVKCRIRILVVGRSRLEGVVRIGSGLLLKRSEELMVKCLGQKFQNWMLWQFSRISKKILPQVTQFIVAKCSQRLHGQRL